MPDDRPVSPEERVLDVLNDFRVGYTDLFKPHAMDRYRANLTAAILAALSTPSPEEPKVAMVKAALMEELFWLNGAVAAEIVERLPGKFESLTAFFYEAADQHLADPGAATTREGR